MIHLRSCVLVFAAISAPVAAAAPWQGFLDPTKETVIETGSSYQASNSGAVQTPAPFRGIAQVDIPAGTHDTPSLEAYAVNSTGTVQANTGAYARSIYSWEITASSKAAADAFVAQGAGATATGSYYLTAIGQASSDVYLLSATQYNSFPFDSSTTGYTVANASYSFTERCTSDEPICAAAGKQGDYTSGALQYVRLDDTHFAGYIELLAEVGFASYYNANGATYSAGSATIDPTIVIDPVFLAANPTYSFQVADVQTPASAPPSGSSSGSGAGAVPELGPWALMLIGFGAIGVPLRRRRGVLARAN